MALTAAHRVALDARHLHQAADRVAGQPEVVLHADLRGVLDLGPACPRAPRRARQRPSSRQTRPRPGSRPRRPRSRRSPCTARRSRPAVSRKQYDSPSSSGTWHEPAVVLQHRRDDACRAVGRSGHDPAACGVLLVDRKRVEVDPVHDLERIRIGLFDGQSMEQFGRPPTHLEPAGQDAAAVTGAVDDALLHDAPDLQQPFAHLVGGPPCRLVGHHHCADRPPGLGTAFEQFHPGVEGIALLGGVGDDPGGTGFGLIDDETPPTE